MSLRLAAYGEFDCDFDFDSQEWSCSNDDNRSHHVLWTGIQAGKPLTITDVGATIDPRQTMGVSRVYESEQATHGLRFRICR